MTDSVHMRPIIGARVKSTEDPRLLAGRRSFVDDRQEANASHVAFHRNNHPHARFVTIDTSKARAAPGIVPVFTAEDIAGLCEPLKTTSQMGDKLELLLAESLRVAYASGAPAS